MSFACTDKKPVVEEEPKEEEHTGPFSADEFVMGVDLSYVNQVEDHGGVYRDSSKVRDPFRIMKNHGGNMVRVRLWHNPVWVRTVYNNQQKTLYSGFADVVKTIQRAKALGMAVNLDFHYSDSWADPGKQKPPVAWENITSLQVLKDSVYNYTFSVLNKLNKLGLMPEMVQIGNETNCGMMTTGTKSGFPNLNGCSEKWQDLGAVMNSGIKAVRDVSAQSAVKTKVALHVADPKNVEWWVGKIMTSAAVTDFDIIGMSYYPLWHTTIGFGNLPDLISKLKSTFNKKVMILETAYPWTTEYADSYNNQFGSQSPLIGYPFTKEGQTQFMTNLCQNVMNAGGSGVFYWEPAWTSSQLKDLWGTGSSWENCTFFDFSGNVLPVIDYMRSTYTIRK
ncbi:MAG: glycosyl hydrolase 53 family protein [Prolixibacteraceae bacterium]|nr:glycosyl hydrolase 53 family protein [Prolixibacteraceae bacterium]